jgi:hypothetical protein
MPFVHNATDVDFNDAYAGVGVHIPAGRAVEISPEAARHIFGWCDPDKEPYLARLGWIRLATDIPEGLKKLDQFRITEGPVAMPDNTGVVALPIQRGKRA